MVIRWEHYNTEDQWLGMNNVLIPNERDFLKISVFFSGTLKRRKSALASGFSSLIVVFKGEVQHAAQQAWLEWWHKREALHCFLPAVILAQQLWGEFEQSDFIISSLLVSHLSVLWLLNSQFLIPFLFCFIFFVVFIIKKKSNNPNEIEAVYVMMRF